MNISKEQVELAIGAGLAVIGEKADTAIPAKYITGIQILRQLLILIGSGQVALSPTMKQAPAVPDSIPGKGKRGRKAAARKKKKASKKNAKK